jgi:RNA polymerase sigma factor (sigma-70 family)
MTSGTIGSSLKHLRDLFGGGTAVGLTDTELLARYAETRDAPAFEALVARHGPMVAATCRAVLRNQHDVEDAFQATFLVLARKSATVRTCDCLGGWLHRVAYRAAVQLSVEAKRRRQHESEGSAMDVPDTTRPSLDFDVRSILHDAIDRLPDSQRLPIVLCDLEGLTYEQAAGRLHLTVPALYHRLAKSRRRLRDRLVRRGVTSAALAAALETSQAAATAGVSASWVQAAVAAATGGPTGALVAAVSHSIIKSLLVSRLKLASVTILAMAALVSTGVVVVRAARLADPKPTPPALSAAPNPADEPKPVAQAKAALGTITIEARDLVTDAPVPDVQLEFRLGGGSKEIPAATAASGTAQFSHAADIRYFYVSASREGFVPQAIRWDSDASSPKPPDRLLFQMEKGTTISGRVVDQDHRPVAGATVIVDVKKGYPKSPQWVDFKYEATKTDNDGHWSFSSVPAQPDAVELAAYHHLYLQEDPYCFLEEFKPISALRDGTAALRLSRGTTFEGTVVAPDGKPVADAEVIYGEPRAGPNTIAPLKTDARGRFTLGVKPGAISKLTARHTGFGPALHLIRAGSDPQQITLRLEPAHTLSGRVVNPAGKPIAQATVRVTSWRGTQWLSSDLKTDEAGRFAWNEAPGDEVKIHVYAQGYASKDDVPLLPGPLHEIVLTPPTTIKGTVLDADTGQPIPQFSLVLGAVWNHEAHVRWQRGFGTDRQAKKQAGSFEYALLQQPAEQCLMRVSADGYLPEDSGLFLADHRIHDFSFRLTRSGPISGTIQKPDGSPAPGTLVYLVLADHDLSVENGDVRNSQFEIRARTGPDGRFTLPPHKENYLLAALGDAGFAVVHRRDLRGADTLRLEPWAHVTGTVRIDGQPAAGLALSSSPDERPTPIEGEPLLVSHVFVKTDANGRFDVPRLMPGRHVLGQWVPNGVAQRGWFVSLATLDAASGTAYDLKIGELGRRVIGRLAIPPGGQPMVRKASIELVASKPQSPSIGVQVFADGHFRAQDLSPGDYVLRVAIHEAPPENACGWGRLIAAFSREFAVSGKADDSPLDLGSLQPAEVGGRPLNVGEIAPEFAVKTLDGRNLSLADFRGKFVLLDFWATWCAPCVAEIPNLEAVHKAFGGDPRFAIVSLSLDERPSDAAFFVKSQNLNWHQACIGPESSVVSDYDAAAIPATFLVGPDGKVLAKDLRGPKIMPAVAGALKP